MSNIDFPFFSLLVAETQIAGGNQNLKKGCGNANLYFSLMFVNFSTK